MRASSVDQAILEVLSRENAHLTSARVYEEIRDRLPAVNPSTVYRALERLVRQGKVSVSDMGTGSAVYERLAGESHHHHLVCQQCGAVTTLDPQCVEAFFSSVKQRSQFNIVTNHLILFGVCSHCQEEDHTSQPK